MLVRLDRTVADLIALAPKLGFKLRSVHRISPFGQQNLDNPRPCVVRYSRHNTLWRTTLSTIADKIAQEVGLAIKARREALGFTLRVLADRSGVSSSMISDIERGAKSPTISTLSRL